MSTNPSTPGGAFVHRTAQAAHEAIDQVASTAEGALDQLNTSASQAAQTLEDKARELGDLEYQWLEALRDCVRDHPVASVLTAVAVGVVVSRLIQQPSN